MKTRLGLLTILAVAGSALAGEPEHWLHIRVEDRGGRGENVSLNVPLTLAEKVLPAINADQLRGGRVRLHCADLNGVDLRALLSAVHGAADGEFVTVASPEENVRVAKQADHLIVQVKEKHGRVQGKQRNASQVQIKVPMVVAEALLRGPKDQLDLVAAVRALNSYGASELVAVEDDDQTVHIWVDDRSAAD
jgi:hypothetical protein